MELGVIIRAPFQAGPREQVFFFTLEELKFMIGSKRGGGRHRENKSVS